MLNIKYEEIGNCKPGQIVAKNVYNKRGVLLVSKNVVLNEYVLERLIEVGVTSLPIIADHFMADCPSEETPQEKVIKSYQKDIEEYKEILNDLAAGQKLDYEQVNALTSSIYQKVNHNIYLGDCLNQLKEKDQYTFSYTINVALYSMMIAKWLDLPDEQISGVIQAGVLHDIGKTKIDQKILNKEGALSPEEFEQVKQHPVFSYQMIKDIPHISRKILAGVLMHHEREDGKGYPLAVSGNQIPLFAKIVAVADVYDALTSERAYKKRATPFETFREFEKIGYGQFDVKIMLTFLTNIANFYVGTKVKMNTGEVGEIVFIPPYSISKPVVSCGGKYIDLSKDTSNTIEEML